MKNEEIHKEKNWRSSVCLKLTEIILKADKSDWHVGNVVILKKKK